MGERGPDRSVTDEELLLEFVLTPDPALFASELENEFEISRQQINNLLDDLEHQGALASKSEAGRRLWWITTEGEQRLADIDRGEL